METYLGVRIRICILVFHLVALGPFVHAQSDQFRFKHLTVDEGLSHTDANDITQDSRGFIWIATYFGLNRYDGYTVKKFYNSNEPVSNAFKNRIRCILANGPNQIWLGTEGGIQLFDPGRQSYTDFTIVGAKKFTAKKMWMPDRHTLYIIADDHLLRFRISGQNLFYQPVNIPPENHVYDFAQAGKSKLLIATEKGIMSLDPNTGKAKLIIVPSTPVPATALLVDREKNILLAGGGRIYRMSPRHDGQSYTLKDSIILPRKHPADKMLQDSRGDYWAVSSPNLLRIGADLKIKQTIRAGQGSYDINSASMSAILIDRSQCLWIATFSGGVNYCDLNQKRFYTFQHEPGNPNSLSGNYVRSILAEGNSLWVGTMDHGLNRYNFLTQKFEHFSTTSAPFRLKNETVLSLASDRQKRLWIGTQTGIQVIDPETLKTHILKGEENFPRHSIENLAVDVFGNIWFGNHTDAFGVVWKDDSDSYHVRYIGEGYFILPDKNSPRVMVSSTQGVHVYQTDRSGNIVHKASYQADGSKNSLSSNYAYPISKQSDSVYWIGTIGGGLNRLSLSPDGRHRIENYNNRYDIFKDVEAMELDDQGNVWMGGNGLQYLNLDRKELIRFNKNDGLQGNSFKVGSSFRGSNGRLYFGGINGLTFFDPKEISANSIAAMPVITDVLINNQQTGAPMGKQLSNIPTEAITSGTPLTLNYLQNNFIIFFSAMHFPNAPKCRYRYKLIGYDRNWVYTDGAKPSAFYSNLDYNDYKFLVQATNNDGLWGREEAVLLLTISPPWWKSVPAKILYALLLLSILSGIYIYQARWYRLKKDLAVRQIDEARREEIHQHREELYQQQLTFFTNISHEFRTPLTLIIGPLEALIRERQESVLQSSYQMMLRNARRLLNLITELMNFKKITDSVIRLRVAPLDIAEFCEGIAAEFEEIASARQITFTFKDRSGLDQYSKSQGVFDVQVLEKIIYNLLNNAFKYTDVNGSVRFELLSDLSAYRPGFRNEFILEDDSFTADRYLYLLVADSGIGISEDSIDKIFDRYYRVNNKHLGSGIGLALVKSLTQLHKGNIHVYSERNKGTEIIIGIPWGEHNYSAEEKAVGGDQSAQLEVTIPADIVMASSEENKPELAHAAKTILIVDDNEELRAFLRHTLAKQYVIIEAENGQDAIEKTIADLPDLVISDIMMPLMDGIEFCKVIKERFETRHLPLILLSAKDSLETKIAGLESGADYYFSKPLSIELLMLTIHNIFLRQHVVKETYTNNYLSEATELVSSEKDKEFFNKLLSVIEENIERPELDVDFLCKQIFVSRTKLYQKIKSISGQSVAEFIRTVRLKRSIFIMTHEDITMNEVAERIGLQSSSNFSRAFKKEYGKSPMQFMQSLKKNP